MTGTHPVTQEEVMAWLDGELPAPRAADVATHVTSCADCDALAADLRSVSRRVGAWTVAPPPAAWTVEPPPAAWTVEPPSAEGRSARASIGPAAAAPSRRRLPRRVVLTAALAASIALAILLPLTMRSLQRDGLTAVSVELGPAAATTPPKTISLEPSLEYPSSLQSLRGPQAVEQPMIARTVSMSLTTERFDEARSALERAVAAEGGSIAAFTSDGEPRRRTLRATVRVPAARLDAALAAFRALGVVKHESLETADVSDSYRDLTVRIRNARIEEQRLVELLKTRTGTVKDVLDVEREIARVRSEAERMAAEAESTRNRVTFSLVRLDIAETYRAEIASAGALPVGLRLRNAFVEGVRAARQSLLEVALEIARTGPTLVAWGVLIGPAVWLAMRRLRRRA